MTFKGTKLEKIENINKVSQKQITTQFYEELTQQLATLKSWLRA